jgi:uncharacterized protein
MNHSNFSIKAKSWGPYAVGISIGVLSWFTFASADHPLGITTAFEYSAALLLKPFDAFSEYYSENKPLIDWEWMLVLGVFIGAWMSSKLSGDRSNNPVPLIWRRRFGPSVGKRMVGAFFGGLLMMYGARLAQGCTSGHGISGVLQFALASWIFVAVFAVVGIFLARMMFPQSRS